MRISLFLCLLTGLFLNSCGDATTSNKEHTENHDGHDHAGHDHAGHDHSGHDHSGHDHDSHDHSGHDHAGHDHGSQSFGAKISTDGAITYDQLLAKMNTEKEVETTVRGKVAAVCQTKGCWMNIESDQSEQAMFVKFEDYGFFMPMDIAGKEVIMKGKAYTETTSVADLKHYAEDEGLSKEEIAAITEPKEELKFMATGVVLVND